MNLKSLFLNASSVQSSSFWICSSFSSSRYEPTLPFRRKLLQKKGKIYLHLKSNVFTKEQSSVHISDVIAIKENVFT